MTGDFDSPEEKAKREHCARFGHVTLHELETTGATHGTKHCCTHCGKFWHGEPTPKELTNADEDLER